jgi:hypothetical protein
VFIVCWSKIAAASRRHFIACARSASEDMSVRRIIVSCEYKLIAGTIG